jgi:hypothetical protein
LGTSLANRALALALLSVALACRRDAPAGDFPGLLLLGRVEARLERERSALRPMLEHYALVFPLEPADLDAFMQAVRVHGHGPDLALGDEHGLEAHGGGVLRLLFEHWRPEGRAPTLDDRFPFEAGRRPLALRQLYEASRQQLFLPRGEFPQLPRMRVRFRSPGQPVRIIESDAYHLLRLSIALEPDPSRSWLDRAGQSLSLDLLMRNVRAHHLAGRVSAGAPRDHSNLHLVELLVAFGGDLAPVQQQFLAGELAQQDFAPLDADAVLAHHVESLGHLLEAPALSWGDEDRQRVKRWLARLEHTRLRDVGDLDLDALSHLARGLRAVRAQRAELE